MKYPFRANIIVLIFALLVACGQVSQLSPVPSATPLPVNTPIPSQTATLQMEALPTLDTYALPTFSFTTPDGTKIPFPTPNPKIPTLLPTIDPNLLTDQLQKSISIQTLSGVNGHNIQRITGSDYGFRQGPCYPYQWLDSNHLLLYPRTGNRINEYHDGARREDLGSEPVILNLTNGTFWLRPFSSVAPTIIPDQDCNSVYWSQDLGFIINQQNYGTTFGPSKDAVFIYTFDGQEVTQYWGKILGVSPSGAKVFVDEDTVIDLRQNKIIDLAWHMNYDVGDSPTLYWSSDENRLYKCCFYYADLNTGQSFDFQWNNLHGADGSPLTFPMHPHNYGQWVRNDSYFLIEWDYWTVSYNDPIPMFSPSEKKYYDLAEMAGIPSALATNSTYTVSPDGMYVWISGFSNADGVIHNFLVNLNNFETTSYDMAGGDFEWSPDGKFGCLSFSSDNISFQINLLSVSSKKLETLDLASCHSWRPNDHLLAYLTEEGQVLTILNPKDMSVKGWKLPSTFDGLIWSPDGDHIALIAKDGSFWRVDYPNMENFEQLTQPMSFTDVRDIIWSPDGTSIAFIKGTDIYIIDTNK
jgi:hypothetical protein